MVQINSPVLMDMKAAYVFCWCWPHNFVTMHSIAVQAVMQTPKERPEPSNVRQTEWQRLVEASKPGTGGGYWTSWSRSGQGGMGRIRSGGEFSNDRAYQIPTPFLGLIHLHVSTQACTSDLFGIGPSWPIASAGAYKIVIQSCPSGLSGWEKSDLGVLPYLLTFERP